MINPFKYNLNSCMINCLNMTNGNNQERIKWAWIFYWLCYTDPTNQTFTFSLWTGSWKPLKITASSILFSSPPIGVSVSYIAGWITQALPNFPSILSFPLAKGQLTPVKMSRLTVRSLQRLPHQSSHERKGIHWTHPQVGGRGHGGERDEQVTKQVLIKRKVSGFFQP